MRALWVALCLCVCGPAMARENYALLIGANDYPNLDAQYWLKGPSNDVALVATYLATAAPVPFAPDHITVLTNGAGQTPPTLEAIRGAMADLAARVAPGDFVYLHFSGHGTQAPAADPATELDGLDELFLPTDIGPWDDSTGHVDNALVDDEIGLMIDSLRAGGADVWAVFDSCHSGTVTRAGPSGDEEVRSRQLPPEALGIDIAGVQTRALPDPRAGAEAPFDAGSGKGSFVAFFAAQTNEVTPEKNLPKGKPGRKPQGVFTYALIETLAEYPGATYGQVASEVLRKYAVQNLARSTPLFEGDLDRVVFGGAGGGRVAQWVGVPIEGGFSLAAGTLHGLAPGDMLAVMASAADATDAALGYAQIATADTFTATATPVDYDGKTLPADLPRGVMLRKLADDLDFTLTVALPTPGTAPADALTAAMALVEAGPRLAFVPEGTDADVVLAVLPDSPRPDAIWLLPGTGLASDLATTPSISTADKSPEDLALAMGQTLGGMGRALNLLKLGAAVGAGSLDVTVEMQTRTPTDRTLHALPAAPVPTLLPEDEVHVLAQNNMDVPVDVNVLYVAADYAISHWFSGRLQPGDVLKKGLFKIGGDVLGQERMVVVLTPALPQSPVEDLSFLAQPSVELTRGAGSALSLALRDAGFGETTRGAVGLEEDTTGLAPGILQLELRTVAGE